MPNKEQSKSVTVRSQAVVAILASLFVLSMAFDFKGPIGGTPIQFAMAGFNTLMFLLIAFRFRLTVPTTGLSGYVVWGWLGFLVSGSIGALISGVPAGQYVRIVYSYALFIEGVLVARWVVSYTQAAPALLKSMVAAAALSMCFTVYWGLHFTGDTVDKAHFAILSPLLPFVITTAGYDLIFARHRRISSFVLLSVALLIVAVSAVRGMLLVLSWVALAMIVGWIINVMRGDLYLPNPLTTAVKWLLLVAVVSISAVAILAPDMLSYWGTRLTGVGHDVTFWTRVAAVVGQWDELKSNVSAWLFGRGFGHAYQWSKEFTIYTFPYVTPKDFETNYWYPGEFMWITPWFYSGFLWGSVGLVALLLGTAAAVGRFAAVLRCRNWCGNYERVVAVGALGFLGFVGISFTSNPFMQRITPMFMGLCLGMLLARPASARA